MWKKVIDEGTIKEVEITYEQQDGSYKNINIDFESCTRTTKRYGDYKELCEDDYTPSKEFSLFIRQNVLQNLVSNKEKGDLDTEKLKWEIKVWIEDRYYRMAGYGNDEYPSYWNELLEFVE